MPRLATLMLIAGLVGGSLADDKPPPAKMPRFKDYTALPDPVVGKVKAAEDDTVTVVVPEYSVRTPGGRSKRPPAVSAKEVEYTLTLHEDALVRWSKKLDRKDAKGRRKEYTPAEMKRLQAPLGAPGYLGDKLELAKGQTVEITLLLPTKVKPEELTVQDYRIKWIVIQGSPPDPKDVKPAEEKKKDKK